MPRAYFPFLLSLFGLYLSAQTPFDRFAYAETGLNAKLIFPLSDGSYLFEGENGTEYADTPVLAAFSAQGTLQWRNDFEPYETWYQGPRYVFPTAAGELLVLGNYGFECDVILQEGLKIARVDTALRPIDIRRLGYHGGRTPNGGSYVPRAPQRVFRFPRLFRTAAHLSGEGQFPGPQ